MGYLSMGWSMEYHICFYIPKMFVLVCSFKIQRLLPWQTLHNSSIQDGVQDGCHFLKSTPIQKCIIFFMCLHCNGILMSHFM